jgi:hypothetical protein
MNTNASFEKLYRKQCEEHEATYAKMNEFRKEATNLRALLIDEQNAHERTKDIFRKAFSEAGL